MGDPLSITTSALALIGVVLKVSVTAIGMVDKTTGAHEAARDSLRNLRRALQNLNKGTSNIQTILRILISDPKDKAVKQLLALPDGEVAVKELCESLESTRGLLAERAGQAQLEATGLDPLPQDRKSLAFVQAVFKHNFSPSNIEDAIIALKDFQFEVESCQQTTELAFQQVWRVYDIVKSRALQRRSSVSTISSISTQIPETSTGPQTTTSFRREITDWLKRQDVASKAHSGIPNFATQTWSGARASTSAAGRTPAPENQPTPVSGQQGPSRSRIRNIFGLSGAKQEYKKTEHEATQDFMTIEPFQIFTPPPEQSSPRATEQPSQRRSQAIYPRTVTGEDWMGIDDFSAHTENGSVPTSQSQAPLPIPESHTPLAPFLQPGAAYGPLSTKPLPAVLTETSGPSMGGIAGFPRTYGHISDSSVQYDNDRSGVERHDNSGDGSIHSQEKGKVWARGIFGSSKEREHEKEALKELSRIIGLLTATATASDDLTMVMELCERTSTSKSAAKEAAKALRQEFKYADAPAQFSAARLWAIMLLYSNEDFITQTATKKFMETVESVITTPTTSPVVRERLIDVLAAAAFMFHGPNEEGFQSTWERVRPPHKPKGGAPFDMDGPIFNVTTSGTSTNDASTVTSFNVSHSPRVYRPNQIWEHDQGDRNRDRSLSHPGHWRAQYPIPSEGERRMILQECDVAHRRIRILKDALANAAPDSVHSNPIIQEYHRICQKSHAVITSRIPWASMGAARSQERRTTGQGALDMTKEEEILQALLSANDALVGVFELYNGFEAAAKAEEVTVTVTVHGGAEQTTDRTGTVLEDAPMPLQTQENSDSSSVSSGRRPQSRTSSLESLTSTASWRPIPLPDSMPVACLARSGAVRGGQFVDHAGDRHKDTA